MQEKSLDIGKEIELLTSEDPSIRRETAEKYITEHAPDEIVKVMAEKLLDPDNGVRDSINQSLVFNENKNIPHYVVPYTGSSLEISTRNLAGEILLKRGVSSIEAMVNFIDKGNDDDKKFIIDLLGLIGDKKPAKKIVEVLSTNKDENVILACFEAIGNIRAEEEIETIEKFYDKNELYKPTIIEALGKIGSDRAVGFIINKYSQEDELTKFSIIESLGQVGNEEAFFMLLRELGNMSEGLTWAAIATLRKLKEKYDLDVPFDENMKGSILSTLIEAEVEYKRAASYLITVFEDKDIVEACLKILGEDEEVDYNIKAQFLNNPVFAYPKMAEYLKIKPQNTKVLLELIVTMIQNDGAQSLGQLSDREFRSLEDAFIVSMESSDEEVRKYAVELLFFINTETALVFIDKIMEDDNYWNRLRLLEILENIEDQRADDAIKLLTSDKVEMVREKAEQIITNRNI